MGKMEKVESDIRKNLIYGVFGIVMSIVGFVVWMWAFMEKTEEHIMMFLSFGRMFGISALQFLPESIAGIVVTKTALIGIASTIAILFTLWGIGYWKGEQKLSVLEFVSKIGGTHYYIGAGFLIASATVFIDWKLSIGVLILNLLLGMLLLFVMSAKIFNVPPNRTILFVAISFVAYITLLVFMMFLII